jgi:glycosyltransferase involved in cell wall biosynthesis
MKREEISNIAFLGNYLPRRCGIATFTTDLCEAVAKVSPMASVSAIAMTNTSEGYNYPKRVSFEIRQKSLSDYKKAADYVNSSGVEILCLQHEFGIFGGKWGGHLLTFLESVNVPVVTTFHTVLNEDLGQEDVFAEICRRSSKLVVMSKRALKMLDRNNVPDDKKVFIPHGIPDLPFVDPNYYKENFKAVGKKVILSFGLINPDKGYEYMIQAMPEILKYHPNVIFIVLGSTHPEILKHHGEEYYLSLQRLADKLEISSHVFFHRKFVELDELCEYLCAADIYVTPYLKLEQITSGTLSYALGAGKALVSTPYWYAEELLSEDRGILVGFKDSQENAYQLGREMIWKNVASEYLKLFNEVRSSIERGIDFHIKPKKVIQVTSLPEINLTHLNDLTSHYGVIQHAKYTVPDFKHGYTVDDNARALIFVTKYLKFVEPQLVLPLFNKYLSFVMNAQGDDGWFINFFDMGLNPTAENENFEVHDCQGRALWALGFVIANAPDHYWMIVKSNFERGLKCVNPKNLRGSAFAVLGMYFYLQRYGGAREVSRLLKLACENLVNSFKKHSDEDWHWFEDILTYANGLLPVALFRGYEITKQKEYLHTALKATEFLVNKCIVDDVLSLVGNKGWYRKTDKKKTHYDQQPIDAFWMVDLCKHAYLATKEERYLRLIKTSFDWFLGSNDGNQKLYDFVSGGCCDGLSPSGANINQGAESTISVLLSILNMNEISILQKSSKDCEKMHSFSSSSD